MGESVFVKITVTAREQWLFLGGFEVTRGPASDGPPCSRPPGPHLLSTPLDAPRRPHPPICHWAASDTELEFLYGKIKSLPTSLLSLKQGWEPPAYGPCHLVWPDCSQPLWAMSFG